MIIPSLALQVAFDIRIAAPSYSSNKNNGFAFFYYSNEF